LALNIDFKIAGIFIPKLILKKRDDYWNTFDMSFINWCDLKSSIFVMMPEIKKVLSWLLKNGEISALDSRVAPLYDKWSKIGFHFQKN
jgi:hypothetical protein